MLKHVSKWKWNDRAYHIQDNADVDYSSFKMSCNSNQFPTLQFCGPHNEPHGVHGLINSYNLPLDHTLVHGIYVIKCILCTCVSCI